MKQRNIKKALAGYQTPAIDHEHLEETIHLAQKKLAGKKLRYPISFRELALGQVQYISPSIWLMQSAFLLIIIGLLLNASGSKDLFSSAVTILSASAPLIALAAIPELIKSFNYHTWEAEMACKFTLHKLTAIRLLIMGSIDLFVITCLVIFTSAYYELSFIHLILYVLVPFNVSSSIYLFIISKFRGKKVAYCCLGAGIFIVLGVGILSTFSRIYTFTSTSVWIVLFFLSTSILIYEVIHLLQSIQNNKEELSWNSQSII